jgi:ATP-binding cassette subfamily C protein CydC
VNERAANFSGGEKQRIALARAVLARDADTVILDEPTTGLDSQTAKNFLDELVQVFAGKTIVMITHDNAIMQRADQMVFVDNGQIVLYPEVSKVP